MRAATPAEIGERLKAQRVALEMSQRALAKASGLSHGGVQRIENGAVDARIGSLDKLCRPLGLVVAEVVTAPEGRES